MVTENFKLMKKISFTANAFLVLCVVGMLFVFAYYDVAWMVKLSFPVLVLYALFFVLIAVNRIDIYFWLVYATIGVYMCAATICLGMNYGFNLYCMSLIPIGFFCQYLARKMNSKSVINTGYSCIALIVMYFVSVGIVLANGPVYVVDKNAERIFYIMNSFFVFVFLVAYSAFLVNLVVDSEKKLENMALYDKLTGLYNRHCIMDKLVEMESENKVSWIAIVDIDKFKSINDNYGHNAGDEILRKVSDLMTEVCASCHISRWGGEEFLIVPYDKNVGESILESLRKRVEEEKFKFEDKTILVTVSSGASFYSENDNLENCIKSADRRLYISKNSGRNRVTLKD